MKGVKDVILSFLLGIVIGGLSSAFVILSIWDKPGSNSIAVKPSAVSKAIKPHKINLLRDTFNRAVNGRKQSYTNNQLKDTVFLGFENKRSLSFFSLNDGLYVERTKESKTEGDYSLFAEFPEGASYPGLFWEVYNKGKVLNWSGYESFSFDVYNNNAFPVNLVVKLKSGANYPKKVYEENFDLTPAQWNHISIPVSAMSSKLDASRISYIKLFIPSPGSTVELLFDNFRLNVKKNAFKRLNLFRCAYAMPVAPFNVKVIGSLYKVRPNLSFIKSHIPLKDKAQIELAANEYESFQLLVFDPRKEVHFKIHMDLPNGFKSRIYNVEFVKTKRPYYAVSYVGRWPDPMVEIDAGEEFSLNINEMKLFWVEVYAPQGAVKGKYDGKIILTYAEGAVEIPVSFNVWGFSLGKTPKLRTAFDVYDSFFPRFFTRRKGEDYKLWKNRIGKIKAKFNDLMLYYKMSPMLKVDPSQIGFKDSIMPYVNEGLNAFAVGPKYGGSFGNNWPEGEALEQVAARYGDYQSALSSAGLLDLAYVYAWDEGKIGNPEVKEVTSVLKKFAPGLKLMVCYHGFWDPNAMPGWGDNIDIWCYQISKYNRRLARMWLDMGKELWMYVSGPDGKTPNFVIDSLAVETRLVPWVVFKHGASGLLYWAVNYWNSNPWKDTMNTPWKQNGNGSLFYPYEERVIPSIRCVLIRDGIEDYEYLTILKSLLDEGKVSSGERIRAEKLLSLRGVVNNMRQWSKNPQDLLDMRREIAELIEIAEVGNGDRR